MVDLRSDSEDDPPPDPREQERDENSIALSQISVQDMSDFDKDEFLRDFPPDESQTQKNPGENLDYSYLNHILRSSNVDTPIKQETPQDAKSLPPGTKPGNNLQKDASPPIQKAQAPGHPPVHDPDAQPGLDPTKTVIPLSQ